jgi:hypothetical protein
MKKLTWKLLGVIAIVLALLIATGCQPMEPIDPPTTDTTDGDGNPLPPPNDPPLDTPSADPVFSITLPGVDGVEGTDDDELYAYDGSQLTHLYTGKIANADPRVFSIDDVLHYFDASGSVTDSYWLTVAPDLTEVTPSGASEARSTINVDDVYILEVIPPQEAYDLGAMYEHYTRIFENNVEVNGPWYLNEWNPVKVVEGASGDIFALDDMADYHPLNNTIDAWRVIDGGLIFHDYDQVNNTVYIKDETGSYFTPFLRNYFISAKWQKANGRWYSHNGYEWDNVDGLDETGNACWTWTEEPYPEEFQYVYAQYPIFIPGGVRHENGEDVLYWIECNRGDVWRYIPSTDGLSFYASIYSGDGTRTSGIVDSNNLDPHLIADVLYFTRGETIYQMPMDTLFVTVFGPKGEIAPW